MPWLRDRADVAGQLARYGLVGLCVNLVGYLAYLLITWLGVPPTPTMTGLYAVGAIAGFWGNKRLAFRHQGRWARPAARYVIAHAGGYLLNLMLFMVFFRRLGYPHQAVQAVGIFVVAAYLFLMFRFYVFRPDAATQSAPPEVSA